MPEKKPTESDGLVGIVKTPSHSMRYMSRVLSLPVDRDGNRVTQCRPVSFVHKPSEAASTKSRIVEKATVFPEARPQRAAPPFLSRLVNSVRRIMWRTPKTTFICI